MKLQMTTGVSTISAGGTAEQLTSTAYKCILLHIEAAEDTLLVAGDSNVVGGAAANVDDTTRGVTVSDGAATGNGMLFAEFTAPGAADLGVHMHSGTPYFDLSEFYVDGETGAHYTWFAWHMGTAS